MKEGKKWEKFDVIEASSIIMSFIIQDNYGRLFSYIDTVAQKVEIKEVDQLKRKIAGAFIGRKLENSFDLDEIKENIIDVELHEWVKKICNNDKYIESLEKEQLTELQKMIEYFTGELVKKLSNLIL